MRNRRIGDNRWTRSRPTHRGTCQSLPLLPTGPTLRSVDSTGVSQSARPLEFNDRRGSDASPGGELSDLQSDELHEPPGRDWSALAFILNHETWMGTDTACWPSGQRGERDASEWSQSSEYLPDMRLSQA